MKAVLSLGERTKTRSANAFWTVPSARDLINPDHTCRLYLPHEIQQTSSLALLILQAIMIFCRGRLLMPFCWLCTHSEANCMFTPLGSQRSAAPADSVIPGLRLSRHVSAATGLSTSLSLLCLRRQYQGLTRGLPHKFLLPSPFHFVQHAGMTEPGQRPLERACINVGTAGLGSLLPHNQIHMFLYKKAIAKPVQHVKIVDLWKSKRNQVVCEIGRYF